MKYMNMLLRSVNGWGLWEWVLVGGAILLVGLFCMKGFGSRSNF